MGGVARHPNRSKKNAHRAHGLFTSPHVKAPLYCSVDQSLCCVIFTLSSNLNLRLFFLIFLNSLLGFIVRNNQTIKVEGWQ